MPINDDFNKHILIVEDEGLIAADIQRRLQRLGYREPAIASSGEQAIQCVRSTPFDLILMDIRLKGGMDGIETAGALKAEFRSPVVYITAHSDIETISRAKLTEPLGYLLKPITDGDLRSVVQVSIYKHEMERRVRASEAWMWTTLRSVGEGIVATDPAGDVFFMNPVAEQLTGWSSSDAFGAPLMDVLSLRDETTGEAAQNPVLNQPAGENSVYTLVAKSGSSIAVEVACFENRASEELFGAVLVVRDIRARREMENRLIESQRMEAISSVAGGLAHDFNNQLMVIGGYADELCRRLTGEDKDQAQEIRQIATNAGATTAQLLTLGRRDIPRAEVLDVNELMVEAQPVISHILGETRTLLTSLGSPAGFIRADRTQLRQALLNLALHARDAMTSGGELRFESSICEIDAESPGAQAHRPGTYVRLAVSHTGVDVDPRHIFEPSFGEGGNSAAGLGLPMAHSIIVQCGGSIAAHAAGFEILLPCIGTLLRCGDAATVFLVEDEDSVRRLMHRFLERGGYQILEARNAEEATALANVCKQPIQVLVTDVAMTGMNGADLAKQLEGLNPGMKTLFVSGYRHHSLEHEGLWKDGLNLLPKPFPAAELLRRVEVLLTQ